LHGSDKKKSFVSSDSQKVKMALNQNAIKMILTGRTGQSSQLKIDQ
jgi:hypothetical protein